MLNSVGERLFNVSSAVTVECCVVCVPALWNTSFKLTLSGCVVSICCVGFAFLDVVCNELNDCAWNVCL